MYDIKTIEKTLDLLDRYDGQFAKTARETGIKVGTIRSWFDKRRRGVPLLAKRRKKRSKWSEGQRKAAAMIRKQPGFKKAKGIRLLSCSTGQDPTGFAQHLANALGKPVMAPNKTLWCSPKGTLYVSSDERNLDKGSFVTFKPGGIKHGK